MDTNELIQRGQQIEADMRRELRARALKGDEAALDLLLSFSRHDGKIEALAKAIEIAGENFGKAG